MTSKHIPFILLTLIACGCTENQDHTDPTCDETQGACQTLPQNPETGNENDNPENENDNPENENDNPENENDNPENENDNPGNPDSENGNAETASRACGSTVCTGNQLCVGQVCVERNAKAEDGVACDPDKFLDACDGNQLVTCMAAESGKFETVVTDCEQYSCVLHATKNLGNCNIPDPSCTAPKKMGFCYDMEAGFTSYMDNRECALATDGKFYPFRLDGSSTDCEGGCRDDYSCGLTQETCMPETYVESCDGDIAQSCDVNTNRVYGMNCRRYYNTQCIVTDGKADCDWENMDY